MRLQSLGPEPVARPPPAARNDIQPARLHEEKRRQQRLMRLSRLNFSTSSHSSLQWRCSPAAVSSYVACCITAVLAMGLAVTLLATQAAAEALSCTGVPDGSAACSGCSAAFDGDACGACLMETLNTAPTCTACEGERASGEPVTVECGASCFYCRSCDLRHRGGGGGGLVKMKTPGGVVVETCHCNPDRVRAAAAAARGSNAVRSGGAGTDTLLDGRHGVLQVLPDQTSVATVDGLAVRVTCARMRDNHYRTLVAPLDGRGGSIAAAVPLLEAAVPPPRRASDACADRGNTYRVVPWSGCSLFVQSGGAVSAVHACPPTTAFDVRACTCVHRGSGLQCCS